MTSIGQAHAFPVYINPYCSSSIFRLLPVCCPSAIFRVISLIIINSLNRVFTSWLHPHIFNKVLKPKPPIAHSNASANITSCCTPVTVSASSKHTLPASILTCAFGARGMSVLSDHFYENIFSKASATFGKPPRKAILRNSLSVPTYAQTYPSPSMSVPSRFTSDNGQPTELLSNSVWSMSHNALVPYMFREYQCPYCKKWFKHDEKYAHELFKCPNRPG